MLPTADPGSIFGRIVTRRDVELAVVDHLRKWVPTYVGQLEQQAGFPAATVPMPPDPELSYRAGLDFNTWQPAWSPVYIVLVEPAGSPERVDGTGIYIQGFQVQVACNYQFDGAITDSIGTFEEDSARQYADILGMAGCAAILQHGSLGVWPDGSSVSIKTVLASFPAATFPYAEEEESRKVVRSTFTVETWVADVLTESDGPLEPLQNPYVDAGDWPIVTEPGVVVDAIPITQQVPDAPVPPVPREH